MEASALTGVPMAGSENRKNKFPGVCSARHKLQIAFSLSFCLSLTGQ